MKMVSSCLLCGVMAFVFFFSGCATIDPFYKELMELDRAFDNARLQGKDKECPDAYQTLVKMRTWAQERYLCCKTDEAIQLARETRDKVSALCPPKPEPKVVIKEVIKEVPKEIIKEVIVPKEIIKEVPKEIVVTKEVIKEVPVTVREVPKAVAVPAKVEVKDSDGDGVPDDKDKCPGTPKGAKVNEFGCWVVKILFDTAKWDIKPQSFPALDEVAAVLKKNPDVKIEVQGHTDNVGKPAYNMKLSDNRAKAVVNYLVKKGVKKEMLQAKGYGLTKPIASNDTPEGRAENRRVELHKIAP